MYTVVGKILQNDGTRSIIFLPQKMNRYFTQPFSFKVDTIKSLEVRDGGVNTIHSEKKSLYTITNRI